MRHITELTRRRFDALTRRRTDRRFAAECARHRGVADARKARNINEFGGRFVQGILS
jgi:hypothetical protein